MVWDDLCHIPSNAITSRERRFPTCSNSLSNFLQLEKPVMAQGNVEVWLGTLLQMSRKSVHHVIRTAHTAVQDQGFNLMEFLSTFPAQVV